MPSLSSADETFYTRWKTTRCKCTLTVSEINLIVFFFLSHCSLHPFWSNAKCKIIRVQSASLYQELNCTVNTRYRFPFSGHDETPYRDCNEFQPNQSRATPRGESSSRRGWSCRHAWTCSALIRRLSGVSYSLSRGDSEFCSDEILKC